MSFGRKQKPQPFSMNLPSGDKVMQTYQNGNWTTLPVLSRVNQRQLNQSQNYTAKLIDEMASQPDAARVESYQKLFFEKLRKSIDEGAGTSRSQAQSDLAQRFGGAFNSTFGNDLLSRIEKDRLSALEDAQSNSVLMGQQMLNEADQSRLNKIQVLRGQITSLQQPTLSLLPAALRNTELMNQYSNNRFSDNFSKATTIASSFAKLASFA